MHALCKEFDHYPSSVYKLLRAQGVATCNCPGGGGTAARTGSVFAKDLFSGAHALCHCEFCGVGFSDGSMVVVCYIFIFEIELPLASVLVLENVRRHFGVKLANTYVRVC